MNILRVEDDHIVLEKMSEEILLTEEANSLYICIEKDTALWLDCTFKKDVPYSVAIDVKENVHFSLEMSIEGQKKELSFVYRLGRNSTLDVKEYGSMEEANETINVHLNGENASFTYDLKTLAIKEQVYDIAVDHMGMQTSAVIHNYAVSAHDGKVYFKVSNRVPKGIKGCYIKQESRVITLGTKKSVIEPILLIEENDVDAIHSAHIGRFDEEDLFYLESRGIPKEKAEKLLIEGVLTSKSVSCREKIKNWLNRYWR